MHKAKSSDIIDIDLFDFLFLVEVEVNALLLLFAIRFRVRTFTISVVIAFNELDSTGRSIGIFVDVKILGDFSLSFELPDFVGKVF